MVGWFEGILYLTSPGRPSDIGFQLGKACFPWSRKGKWGNVFIPSITSLSFLFSFISSTISSISFLPFSGSRHKMTYKDWRVVKPLHNQSISRKRTLTYPKLCAWLRISKLNCILQRYIFLQTSNKINASLQKLKTGHQYQHTNKN